MIELDVVFPTKKNAHWLNCEKDKEDSILATAKITLLGVVVQFPWAAVKLFPAPLLSFHAVTKPSVVRTVGVSAASSHNWQPTREVGRNG